MGYHCGKCKRLGKVIQDMQQVLMHKNKVVDRLLNVWCSGGCPTGVGRFHEHEVTLEEVEWAERYAQRLRAHYGSRQSRISRGMG